MNCCYLVLFSLIVSVFTLKAEEMITLDSVVETVYNESGTVGHYISWNFKYDSNYRLIEKDNYYYQISQDNYNDRRSETFIYDDFGNIFIKEKKEYDSNQLRSVGRIENYYNSNNLLTETYDLSMDIGTGTFDTSSVTKNFYDSDSNLDSILIYNEQSIYKTNYIRIQDTLFSYVSYINKDDSTENIKYVEHYIYSENNNLTEYCYYGNTDSLFYIDLKHVYIFNSDNNLIESQVYKVKNHDNELVLDQKYLWIYNKSNELEFHCQKKYLLDESWISEYDSIYYDEKNRISYRIHGQQLNPHDERSMKKIEYKYDTFDNADSIVYYYNHSYQDSTKEQVRYIINNTYNNDFLKDAIINPLDIIFDNDFNDTRQISSSIGYYHDKNANEMKRGVAFDYYYSNSDLSGIEVVFPIQQDHIVYPNPCSDYINFKSNNFKNADLEIYNLDGKIQIKQKVNLHTYINIQKLIPGVYYYKLKTQTDIMVGKFCVSR